QAEDGIRDRNVTGVQTCALPISGTRHPGLGLPVRRRRSPQNTAALSAPPRAHLIPLMFGFSIIKVSGFLGVALSRGTILLKHDFNNSSPSGSQSRPPVITVGPDTLTSGRYGFTRMGSHRTARWCHRRRHRTAVRAR